MNNKTVVIYKSKYGSTKKYAEWIAEGLGCDIMNASDLQKDFYLDYKTIIFGGGLYAGGIAGAAVIKNNWDRIKDKNMIVFTVGASEVANDEKFIPIINRNFTNEQKDKIKFFHLRSSIDYPKLGPIHKVMMSMLKAVIKNKKEADQTHEEKALLETFGGNVDFMDKAYIKPIIEYINQSVN